MDAIFQRTVLHSTGKICIFVFLANIVTIECVANSECVKCAVVGVLLQGVIVCVWCLESVAMDSCGARFQGGFGWSVVVSGGRKTGIQSGDGDFDTCRCIKRMVNGGSHGFTCVWLVIRAWVYAPVSVCTKVFDDLDVAFHVFLDFLKK